MQGFNKLVDSIMGGNLVDSDSNIGNYGRMDSNDMKPIEGKGRNKLVLYLDSGIEIHIPACIFQKMMDTMNGGEETEEEPIENEESSFSNENENENEEESEDEKEKEED